MRVVTQETHTVSLFDPRGGASIRGIKKIAKTREREGRPLADNAVGLRPRTYVRPCGISSIGDTGTIWRGC